MTTWAIHNALKDWVLYDLSEREIQLIVSTLTSSEIKLVYVAKSDNLNWSLLDTVMHSQLFLKTNKSSILFSPPNHIELTEDTITDFISETVPKNIIPRLHKRVQKEYLISIEANEQTMVSVTSDFSIGGLQIKNELPNWVSGYFIVELKTEYENFKLMCSLVEDQKNKHRVQIMNDENDVQYLKYKKWFQTNF